MVVMARITVPRRVSAFKVHFRSDFFFPPTLIKTFFCFARRRYCTEIATSMLRRITGA